LLAELQKRMSAVLAQQDEVARLRGELESERRSMTEQAAELERERARLGTSYRDELERLRDDVTRQLSSELRHLRELDRSSRSSVNVNEVVQLLTKPVEKAMEFIPVEQREVHVGDRAEHRKFKV